MEKSNSEIAAFLRRTATLLEIRGENPFKTRSYRIAAETVDELARDVSALLGDEGVAGLQRLPGIGKSIAAQIAEVVETGTSASFEQLRGEIPETVAELLSVRGIGMKMATALYRDFGVLGLEDLHLFAEGGGFEAISGMGDKQVARLTAAVAAAWKARPKLSLEDARALADRLAEALRAGASVDVAVAGAVRRDAAEVASLDLVAAVEGDRLDVARRFASLPEAGEPRVLTSSRVVTETPEGLPATLWLASPDERAVTLFRATGPRRHTREIEERAAELKVDLRDAATEEEIYASVALRPLAPAER